MKNFPNLSKHEKKIIQEMGDLILQICEAEMIVAFETRLNKILKRKGGSNETK